MRKHFKDAVLPSLLVYSGLSFAGGPLVLGGNSGNTPVTYSNPAIVVNIENGKLGTRSNVQADALVRQALDLWNTVGTATINLIIDETNINLDVNQTNFNKYLPSVNGEVFNADDNLNPIIYDDGGEIIDAYFGNGQSDFTIGFAASILTRRASYFSEGYAVINGKNLDLSDTVFRLLIAHEIGHFIGLDHSQLDINNKEGSIIPFCQANSAYPVMYPFACRNGNSLHEDDISAISALYPRSRAPNADFGVLSGRLTDQSGNAILGANIWAQENSGKTYSIVSDYLKQGTGFYKLLLPAGNYTLHVNSINPEFNVGSSVGPYSLKTDGLSFTCANGIAPTAYEDVITVPANQTTVIDFRLSEINIDDCAIAPPTKTSSDKKSSGALSVSGLSMLFLLLVTYRLTHRTRRSFPASPR